jgi:hypothetical protein
MSLHARRLAAILIAGVGLSLSTPAAHAATPEEDVVASREQGKVVITAAIAKLQALETSITSGAIDLPFVRQAQQPVIDQIETWLRVPYSSGSFLAAVIRAKNSMAANLATGSAMRYTATNGICATGYAWSNVGHPELGVDVCTPFLAKGPICKLTVINHEFFHLVGAHHGEAGGAPVPANFYDRNMEHALDHADHLSGLATALSFGHAHHCDGNE